MPASARGAPGAAVADAAQTLGALPEPAPGRRRREDFIGRTLDRLGAAVREAMAQERSARADGWLQAVDARSKIVAALVLIVAATFVRHAGLLVVLYAVGLAAALSSRVPAATTLKRVWLTVPLFTGAIVAPAILNVVTPGEPIVVIASLPPGVHLGPWALPQVLAVTRPGLDAAALVVARVATGVSLAVLLTATTRWQRLLGALRALRVPATFVMVAEMTYRYFFVLGGLAQEDFLARRSRTIVEPGRADARRFVAGRAGGLFRRSMRLAIDVNRAMVSRGWDGEPRTLGARSLRGADVVLPVAAVGIALVLLVVDKAML